MTIYHYIFWLLMGVLTAHFAHKRGRDPFLWFFIGVILGVFGVILVFILPPVSSTSLENKETPEIELKADLIPTELPPITEPLGVEAKEWFYLEADDQKQQGPISFSDLKKLWNEKKINEESYVWSEGMKEWEYISNMPTLEKNLRN